MELSCTCAGCSPQPAGPSPVQVNTVDNKGMSIVASRFLAFVPSYFYSLVLRVLPSLFLVFSSRDFREFGSQPQLSVAQKRTGW